MTAVALIPNALLAVPKTGVTTDKVRALIAEYLYLDLQSVTDEAHFADDLGADSLDCLELMIMLEERFGVEIGDDDADQIVTVGHLIRHIERASRCGV